MRTVTLELLRHGPSHNQLLSPLTPYLALCENHAPVTINVPFEHNQFLHRLTALTYEFGMTPLADNQRKFQLQDTGRELSRLLSAIPGLTAELNRHREQSSEVIHLRLVLSASELALLPFELVLAGNGFPGFGQPLLLQNQAPICLTREVRRVKDPAFPWSPHARVLFVCASPKGVPPVPVEAHMLALRRAVDPWVRYFEEDSDEERRRRVAECLDVLPAATIDDLQDACSTGEYTHVHILAHGVSRHDGFDLRFGIALHGPDAGGEPDVVSGDRLASALRPLIRPAREGFARPMVVTLASCNGAAGGSVVGAGGSVAHALQEAGIPLVIAGQFPLTFGGSVELVQTLYEGLLWGTDPRALLMDLRRRMHVLQPGSHDWAALTAYASLAVDFDEQLSALMIGRARTALEAAMDYSDSVLVKATKGKGSLETMGRATQRIDKPWARMWELVQRIPQRRFELKGLLASLCKRRAEVELASSKIFQMSEQEGEAHRLHCRQWLEQSRRLYWDCYEERRDTAWALVQYLSLTLLLELPARVREPAEERAQAPAEGDSTDAGLDRNRSVELQRLWTLAYAQSLADVEEADARAGWALGNLIELPLLAILLKIDLRHTEWAHAQGAASRVTWEAESQVRVDELLSRAASFEYQDYSTFKQLQRYALWFGYVNPRFVRVGEWAAKLLERFPPEIRGDDQVPSEPAA